MQLVHCADLHLSVEEHDYSFSVLSEIVDVCVASQATYLVLSGDIFDSFHDLERLRGEFRDSVARLKDRCAVILLPGNHEQLRRGTRSLDVFDLGNVVVLSHRPFQLWIHDDTEFLGIPNQAGYDYRDWLVPEKRKATRIALAHATVIGMSYGGLEEETGGAAMDPDLFARFGVDYAALGHIHVRRQDTHGRVCMTYPGSARVWRRGEAGAHGVYLVSGSADKLDARFVPLTAAGTYREYCVPLTLEGQMDRTVWEGETWHPDDWIRLVFSGIVEDEKVVAALEERLRAAYEAQTRRLQIDRQAVLVYPGIASQSLVQRFLKLWRACEPPSSDEEARRSWFRARELALDEMRMLLEAAE